MSDAPVERAFRNEWSAVVATLARRLGDLQLAEDATIMPLSLTILTAAFPSERRGAMVGMWGGIAGLAVASGPLIGGAITQGLDWPWVFWVNVPIGLVAAALSTMRLAESHGPATRLDLPAVALVSGGAIGLVWGLVRANDAGWGSAETLASSPSRPPSSPPTGTRARRPASTPASAPR